MKRNEELATLSLGGGNTFFDKVFEQNLEERKIIINEEITQNVVEEIILQILKYNKEDKDIPMEKRKKIFLYINSVGGCVFNGLAVCDTIKNSKTPVVGIILGYGYSMGCLIFLSCHERIMFPSSSLLIHDGNSTLSGSSGKVKDLQRFYEKVDNLLKDIVVSNSNITSEEYDDNIDREQYILASECKNKELCDKIIGADCNLDYIL